MSKAGKRLIAAANEALAIAKGEADHAGIFIPADIDVRGVRSAAKMSQEAFARAFGFSVDQIRNWEQHRSRPTGAARAYLLLIKQDPARIREMLQSAATSDCEAA